MHNQETMSSSKIPSPRGAQEQTPDAGHVYGPVPVHPIGGYSWNTDELPGVRRSSSIQSPYGNTPNSSLPSNELVLIPSNISYGASDIGSSASALTRVMSPNQVSNYVSRETNQHLLLGCQGICSVCNSVPSDPALCPK